MKTVLKYLYAVRYSRFDYFVLAASLIALSKSGSLAFAFIFIVGSVVSIFGEAAYEGARM